MPLASLVSMLKGVCIRIFLRNEQYKFLQLLQNQLIFQYNPKLGFLQCVMVHPVLFYLVHVQAQASDDSHVEPHTV